MQWLIGSELGKGLRCLLLICVGVLLSFVGSAQSQETEVLDNGLVRLVFSRSRGTFEASSLRGNIRVFSAAPSLQINGRVVSITELTRLEVRHESLQDQLGTGEKLIINYAFKGDLPGLRYELSLYHGQPWVSVTAYIPAGNYKLGDVSLVQGRIRLPEAFKSRIYVNSGTAGGNTGVWAFGMGRWSSANLSVWFLPDLKDALSFGFYSFDRASTTVVSQYESSSEIRVDAVAHYNDFEPKDGELRTESVLLNFREDPLRALEEWTEASVKTVKPQFIDDTHSSYINTWYAIGNKATEAFTLQQAKILRNSPLYGYGVNFVELGEWQRQRYESGESGDSLGYGEDETDKTLYPHGIPWLCDQIHKLGFGCTFGANYAYAGLSTSTAKKSPPWLIKEDLSRLDFGYPIDFTHPDAQKWVYDLYRTAAKIGSKWTWSDFDGGPNSGQLYDPTKVRGFEDIREGIRSIRKAVGTDTFIHRFCCGPYFTYVGLVDRVRTGRDAAGLGDWSGLKDTARQLAGTYMLHKAFWITDPDPLLIGGRDYVHNQDADSVGTDPNFLDEVRMRVQLQISTGGFLTLGENLEDYTPDRFHLLTLVLPSYGAAARPLDLFVHSTPEVYDLPVKTDWDRWHVLLLQNWNDIRKDYAIRFSDLGLDENKTYLVFRFWDQVFLGEYRGGLQISVDKRKGETYAIRESPNHPWVMSTDMHLTQGGVELRDVKYDSAPGRLSGTAQRHSGAEGNIVLFIPAGYRIRAATTAYSQLPQSSGATVVTLNLKFAQEAVSWSADFDKVQ